VEAEEGCLFFEWSRSLDDPTMFVAVEGFRDAAAGAAHVATAHFAELIEKGPDLVAEQPRLIYIDAPQVDGWGPMGEIQPRAERSRAGGIPCSQPGAACRAAGGGHALVR
jgi:hypothetical protein